MSDEPRLTLIDGDGGLPLHTVTKSGLPDWLDEGRGAWRTWLESTGFSGAAGEVAYVPGEDGALAAVICGLGEAPSLWSLARLPARLPTGTYQLVSGDSGLDGSDAALGWALAAYRFDRFKNGGTDESEEYPSLLWPEGADRGFVRAAAQAVFLARDLINRPANDLTPAALGDAVKSLAERHGASFVEIVGDDLLEANYPAIHVVGRAAEVPPRLLDIRWGREDAPKLTLVGKGIVFDSGGLDLKPSGAMKTMKKDMGGSAHTLGLAHMIMATGMDVRLRVLIAAAENAVSARSFRPLDVIQTRKGLSVEVGNTDAEGRLVLADALFEAASEEPDVIVDFATLTGAARVALGTELPALFCNDDTLAAALLAGGQSVDDAMWRLPLWPGYRRYLTSSVADLSSTGEVPLGGAITAALFLEHFVEPRTAWAHLDLMAWNNADRPGRPKGGEAMALRGIFAGLKAHFAPGD